MRASPFAALCPRRTPLAAALAIALAFAPGLARADDAAARTSSVAIRDVWARATPAGARMGAIYLTLESAAGDRLLGAAVPRSIAGDTQIHESLVDSTSGRMMMRQVDAIELPAGEAVTLAPGGYHVMLIDLKKRLKAGAHVPLRLTLEKAGKREVIAIVREE